MGKLTDTAIKALKPTGKRTKHFDGDGLYLCVLPSGSKSWRVDYRIAGKYKTATLGKYPTLTLAEARRKTFELKSKLSNGIDPQLEKETQLKAQQDEIENTFEKVAARWLENKQNIKNIKDKKDIASKIERFLYPSLEGKNIKTLTSRDILDTLRKIEAKGLHETTRKALGHCSQIFAFAIAEGSADTNPCINLRGLLQKSKTKYYPFISEPKDFGKLLYDIDNYPHGILIKIALQIAPLVFLRPTELVESTWDEIDFENALWRISEDRMKKENYHIIPLSRQVTNLLKELYEITGCTPYLFANWNKRNKPIRIESLRKGLILLGYEGKHTPHGFRHSASTLLNELEYNRDHVEKQLAHSSGGSIRGVYNHAEYLQGRRILMQDWADYCDKLKEPYWTKKIETE